MGERSVNYRSPLARLIPSTTDTEKIKRDGYHIDGILVVPLDDERLDWTDVQELKRIGEQLYGREKGEH